MEAKQSSRDVGSKRARIDQDLSITVLTKASSHLPQRCPFPSCVKREKIKCHVQRQHLPIIFSDINPIRSIYETALCQLQYSSLRSLVIGALGQNADVYSAVDYVNQSGVIPKNTKNIEQPTNTEDGQVPVIVSSTEDEFTVIDVSYGSDVEVFREDIITVNKACDSHFHLDRTSFRIWKKSSGKSVEDLISYGLFCNQHPQLYVSVSGGGIVYSEPSTHQETVPVHSPWGIPVGVHPKHIIEFSRDRFLHMEKLLNTPHVVALGEVGLDRTVPVKLWRQQEAVLRRVNSYSQGQGSCSSLAWNSFRQNWDDVHARCMQILQKSCDPDQPIHLHRHR